jgi:small subunit ribosomal protein S20
MPIIKSATKKVRKDKLRTARNQKREAALKTLVKKARVSKTAKDLTAAFSALDKAAKVHLIHPNKAARLKSRLSKDGKSPVITKPAAKKSAKK